MAAPDYKMGPVSSFEAISEGAPGNRTFYLNAKSLSEDKLKGFETGADDYMTKPFSMEELMARITAILRRSSVLLTVKPISKLAMTILPTRRNMTKNN